MTEHGPLTRKVLDYTRTMERLAPDVRSAVDWEPLEAFVAVDDFRRVGTFLEVQDWKQYTAMLVQWAGTIDRFETVLRRVSELPGLVYYEVEERHHRGANVHIVNSMTVFAFDDAGKISSLDVYLQQAR